MPNSKLEIQITKDSNNKDIDLKSLSIGAADAFIKLVSALKKIAELTPNNKDIRIKIEEGSAVAALNTNPIQLATIQKEFNNVVNGLSKNNELVSSWRTIQSVLQKNGLQYKANFHTVNNTIDIYNDLTKSKRFYTKRTKIKYQSSIKFLSGKLIEVGGKKPNIHLEVNGNKVTINCSETNAKRANMYLYDTIHISTWEKTSKQKKPDYELCDVYKKEDLNLYNSFNDFTTKELDIDDELEALSSIHDKCEYYLDHKDFYSLKRFLRLFMHDSFDINTFKTILVITKAFQNHEDISKELEKIENLMILKLEKLKIPQIGYQ